MHNKKSLPSEMCDLVAIDYILCNKSLDLNERYECSCEKEFRTKVDVHCNCQKTAC